MKTSIKLTAILMAASVSVFAITPSFAKAVPSPAAAITFSSLPSLKGIDVKLEKGTAEKAIVMITDADGNVIRKDALTTSKGLEKAYVLNELENGDYTIAVIANHQTVKKDIHVYDENGAKQFIIID